MADTKISALPASTTPLAGTEVLPIVQSSATKQVSVANLTAGRAISATQLTLSTGSVIPATAGQGIDFSANTGAAGMTSELLNWYEEGTWTPTDDSGASLTLTNTSGNCFYTRVGRVVVATLMFTFPVTASASTMLIGGLPFTSKSTTNAVAGVLISHSDYGSGLYGRVNSNATTFTFFTLVPTALTNVNMSGKSLRGTITYVV